VVLGLACHLWPYRFPPGPADSADNGSDGEERRWRLAETLKHHQELRRGLGLPLPAPADASRQLLGRAFLLRGHPDLEQPEAVLPEGVRHVGPLWWEPPYDTDEQRDHEALMDRIDRVGKPLVYVHLGRTFGGGSLWRWIDTAFTGTGHQAVVELARTAYRQPAPGADVLTVRLPRMAELVRRAEAVVANGTSVPVLGALLHARPLLLRPNGGEQRLLAAACLRAGVAVELPALAPTDEADRSGTPDGQSADALTRAVGDPALRTREQALGSALAQAKSAVLAAQEIEDACR
jgi:UDP:flavonoid glycosyltransferase YjiC (YdhE family)